MKQTSTWPQINALANSLVVSCQADGGEPLAAVECINALALSAIAGGARGLRLEGDSNIAFVRRHTQLPIIGLTKSKEPGSGQGTALTAVAPASGGTTEPARADVVYITATLDEARAVARAGADIVALDATPRRRPDGSNLKEMIEMIHTQLKKPVWADIAEVEEAQQALELGADVISTTLYGYTRQTMAAENAPPNFELLSQVCKLSHVPVVLEGRVWEPAQVARAFEYGAWAVVVGSAITRPQLITRRFAAAVPQAL